MDRIWTGNTHSRHVKLGTGGGDGEARGGGGGFELSFPLFSIPQAVSLLEINYRDIFFKAGVLTA